MKLFQIVIFTACLFLSSLYSQVNTESLRRENSIPGVHHNMELDFAYISGNTEIIKLNGSYRMDYVSNPHWYCFLVGEYDHAYEKPNEDFSNKGFVHLRAARPIIPHIHIEGFIQKESNHFIDLQNRELVGAGLRINQFAQLYWGSGIMLEMEKYTNIPLENFIKSTNYLNYSIKFLEILELQNILYYQFKLEKPNDYRILWDGKLTIKGSKGVSFHINTHYRFDESLINPKGDSYFEISNGLGFQF